MPINQIYVYTVCDGQNSTQSSHEKQSPKTFICRFRYYTKLAVSGKHKTGKQQAWSQATDLLLFLTVDVSPVLPCTDCTWILCLCPFIWSSQSNRGKALLKTLSFIYLCEVIKYVCVVAFVNKPTKNWPATDVKVRTGNKYTSTHSPPNWQGLTCVSRDTTGAPGSPMEMSITKTTSALTIHWSEGDIGAAPVTGYVIEARPSGELQHLFIHSVHSSCRRLGTASRSPTLSTALTRFIKTCCANQVSSNFLIKITRGVIQKG